MRIACFVLGIMLLLNALALFRALRELRNFESTLPGKVAGQFSAFRAMFHKLNRYLPPLIALDVVLGLSGLIVALLN